MQDFTPVAGLSGGVLIGLGSALYLLSTGRLAGVSGMLEHLIRPMRAGFGLAALFLAGLPIGALAAVVLVPTLLQPVPIGGGVPWLVAAGLLVGFGTRVANGCTSGHGVCGLPRFSMRSLAATAIFTASAMATVFAVRHVI
jgi:hypothetical protein